MLIQVRVSCLFTILFRALPNKFYASKTPWLDGRLYFCYLCEATWFCQPERLKSNLNLSHNRAIFREYRLQSTEEWFHINGQRHIFHAEEILAYTIFHLHPDLISLKRLLLPTSYFIYLKYRYIIIIDTKTNKKTNKYILTIKMLSIKMVKLGIKKKYRSSKPKLHQPFLNCPF